MDLKEYMPVINGSLKIYVNENGYLTIDKKYHDSVLKLALIHYWKRFSNIIGPERLWNIVSSISSSSFYFNLDGTPVSPAPEIVNLIALEKRKKTIESISSFKYNILEIFGFILIVVVLVFISNDSSRTKIQEFFVSLFQSTTGVK